MLSPETQSRMAVWRQKSADGTITMEEQREAVAALRADRRNAEAAPSTKRSSSTKQPPRAASDMLKDLGSL